MIRQNRAHAWFGTQYSTPDSAQPVHEYLCTPLGHLLLLAQFDGEQVSQHGASVVPRRSPVAHAGGAPGHSTATAPVTTVPSAPFKKAARVTSLSLGSLERITTPPLHYPC